MNGGTRHIIWGELNLLAGFKTDNFFHAKGKRRKVGKLDLIHIQYFYIISTE